LLFAGVYPAIRCGGANLMLKQKNANLILGIFFVTPRRFKNQAI